MHDNNFFNDIKLNGDNQDCKIIDNYRIDFYTPDKSYLDEDNTISVNNVSQISELSNFSSGRFNVNIDSLVFKCCYINSPMPLQSKSLFISYTGARSTNSTIPFFSRWSYYKLRSNACFLGIDDPMYSEYPNLALGWYYGTKDKCYIDYTLQIIESICKKQNIPQHNCIFFSSSGGGYASILASICLPNTLSISINPQLYISTYIYAEVFSKITGIDLNAQDNLLRNDLVQKISKQSNSKHVIIVNILAEYDYSSVVKFAKEFGINSLRYGLNHIKDNILIWIYEAIPEINKTAHVTFETKQIYKIIEYISLEFKNNPSFHVDDYQPLAVLTNEIWYDTSKLHYQISFHPTYSFIFHNNDSINLQYKVLCTGCMIKEVKEVSLNSKEQNYNYYNFSLPCKSGFYIITFCISNLNFNQFSYGLYDIARRKPIKIYESEVITDHVYSLSFELSCSKEEKISFLIYSGILGKTQGNHVTIKSLRLFRK